MRAYFADETDHAILRVTLLEGEDPVVTSELARLEFASALRAAGDSGRVSMWREVLARFDADCGPAGAIRLLRLRPAAILPRARAIVMDHALRTLDAIHLAVAIIECPALAPESGLALVTRDARQAAAARSLGLAVH